MTKKQAKLDLHKTATLSETARLAKNSLSSVDVSKDIPPEDKTVFNSSESAPAKHATSRKASFRDQIIALALTLITCIALIVLLWGEIHVLNLFGNDKISLKVMIGDVLIGATIYLKTAIDFAIFIGKLMQENKGLKGRIGIEIGTALGNGLGTMLILAVWTFFKEIDWLLAIMVFVAALVLFRLAEDGLEHVDHEDKKYPKWFRHSVRLFEKSIKAFNSVTHPFLSKIVPSHSLKPKAATTFKVLLLMSFTVPFILGLDDFAGYVPLFNTVNVFGFAIGVFVGHMVLNIFLYLSPSKTIKIVKNPIISLLGSIAFIVLAAWGMIEAFKLLFGLH